MKSFNQSDRLKKMFNEAPVVSFKRDKNIKAILVHRMNNLQFYGKENRCTKCGKKTVHCADNVMFILRAQKMFFFHFEKKKFTEEFRKPAQTAETS
jgi:hypothetical protein